MSDRNIPPGDDYEIRCPRLGHQITFSYCRVENKGLPCFKTLDCWHAHFEVGNYLQGQLSEEEWKRLFSGPPKAKMLSLVELIEQAKKRKKESA